MIIRICVSISGGRTSAYMAWWLDNNKPLVAAWLGYPDATIEYIYTFANTGMEHDDTLRFMHDVDRYMLGGRVVWLEAVISPAKGAGTRHRIVTYETAYRSHQWMAYDHPYNAVTRKYGVSNRTWQPCTREMKLYTMNSYRREQGILNCPTAIGIRADENRRVRPGASSDGILYPLVDLHPVDKQDVLDFWRQYDWDLTIPEWQGNCIICFKKSDAKLNKVWLETPWVFNFPDAMERFYGRVGPEFIKYPHLPDRAVFRMKRTTQDMIALFRTNPSDPGNFINVTDSGGCSESCEVYETE